MSRSGRPSKADAEAAGGCIGCVSILVAIVLFFSHFAPKFDNVDEPYPVLDDVTVTTETTTAPPDYSEEEEGETETGVRVQFGYACSPVGALGTVEDGRPAKCFMGKDGRRRWGFDSNRG
ncbi:hypothetical protein [Streptomyces stackebrandtii]|uniref:hypothetical protein n=1 Tax=Streptomyces stackebrandtii TaxID=3051177 RepID=UPI0028DD3DED|nr:hypothetical protein [Streptomyces sp. DSM 40976]